MNTFYHGDCLFVMNHDIPPESVDLIYLDPPFFTGKVQRGEWRPEAMEVSYDDSKAFWAAQGVAEVAPMWLKHIAVKRPAFASYLYYMMMRLDACQRVLKRTGTIYLHCDPRASHYLKMVMDEIFGVENFHNEIIWCYAGGGIPKKDYPRKHDVILRYVKSKTFAFNAEYRPYTEGTVQRGRTLVKGKYAEKGLRKEGTPINDWWADVPKITSPTDPEKTGYPTQKPESLLMRIINCSSDEGDVVLDPFCGCGTTAIAASKLNREWIGIDLNKTAFEITIGRFTQLPLGVKGESAKLQYISRNIDEVCQMNGYNSDGS